MAFALVRPLLLLTLSMALAAQSAMRDGPTASIHPYVAPLATNWSSIDIRGTSLFLNHPDGIWNNAEGFGPSGFADTGGLLSDDADSGLVSAHIVPKLGGTWETHEVKDVVPTPVFVDRFVGELRPVGYSGPIQIAFEVFAPKSFATAPNSTW